MDLQFFIALNLMAISGLVILVSLAHRARGSGSWIAVNAVVVVVGLAALRFAWEWSGALVSAAFVPLVLAPSLLFQLAQRRGTMGRQREAARLFRWASLLHPTAASRFGAAISSALSQDTQPQILEALNRLAQESTPEQRLMIAGLAALERSDWQEIIDLAVRSADPGASLSCLVVRALGELGRRDEMVALYERAKARMSGFELALGQLFLLAFTGRTETVDLMLSGRLKHLDGETKSYWRAVVATQSPAQAIEGQRQLTRLAENAGSAKVRSAAGRRLAAADEPGPAMRAATVAVLDDIERQARTAAMLDSRQLRRIPVTLLLVACNLAAFALEVASGGSEDLENLVALGALWPPLVTEAGEWWRLIAATFLHYGPIHLAVNLFILYLLGSTVEITYGSRKFAAIYALGGLGSSTIVLALMHWGVIAEGILIGASGAIFAVFGAEMARHFATWKRSRDTLDKRRMINLGLVMMVQVVIDFSVPEISAAAHLSGFAIGLALGLMLGAPYGEATAA